MKNIIKTMWTLLSYELLDQTWIHERWLFPPGQGNTHHQDTNTHHYDGGTHWHNYVQINPVWQSRETGLCLSIVHIASKGRSKST